MHLTRFHRIPHIALISTLIFIVTFTLYYQITGYILLLVLGIIPLYFLMMAYSQHGICGFLFIIIVMLFGNIYFDTGKISWNMIHIISIWTIFFGIIGHILFLWKQSLNAMLEIINEIQLRRKGVHICCECKCINHNNAWVRIEKILEHQGFERLSHGYCPTCYERTLQKFGLTPPHQDTNP